MQLSMTADLLPEKPISPPFPNRPCLVRVEPSGKTRWRGPSRFEGLVGKVIHCHALGCWVFYSRHKKSKRNLKGGCDFPMDDLLVRWLLQSPVPWVFHYNEDKERLYRQETVMIAEAPLEVHDGENVRLLRDDAWELFEPVLQDNQGYRRLLTSSDQSVIYLVDPHLTSPPLTLRQPGGFSK